MAILIIQGHLVPLAGLSIALLCGCGTEVCPLIAYPALTVLVEDGAFLGAAGAAGAAASDGCSVEVSAASADYSETLSCEVDGSDCVCSGLYDRSGTFDITVGLFSDPEVTLEVQVELKRVSCGVEQQTVTVPRPATR